MDFDNEIALQIRTSVNYGELPTIVFRRLLAKYPNINHYDLGSSFAEAFPDVDGLFGTLSRIGIRLKNTTHLI